MEQQEAKNLINFENFLSSLEEIIGGFKVYVDTTNKRIDDLNKTIKDLSQRINENTSICRESKKETLQKADELNDNLSSQSKEIFSRFDHFNRELNSIKSFISKSTKQEVKSAQTAKKKTNVKSTQKNQEIKRNNDEK